MSPFVKKARATHGDAGPCPISYDIGKAAKRIGVSGQAGPEHGKGTVSAETDKTAGPGSPLADAGGAVVSCAFGIAADKITVYTVGTRRPDYALGLMAPQIASDAQMTSSALQKWLPTAQKAKRGTATVTPSGSVGAVRLSVDGAGDIALVVGEGKDAHTHIGADKMKALTETLAAQADW
ncbi:hypothetical protein [Streptomyces sp. NBC_01089]|uniref:hypothetical protein n=1 Tax=Streptomyces sp. NBC_01089 TaxID=2903747 RepID=UPI00386C86F9|nr:hypothetical protein OG510_15305 [Streptomyces sp. NBC_01089]